MQTGIVASKMVTQVITGEIEIRRRRSKAPRRISSVNYRTNRRIRVPEVRLIDHNGTNHGVVPTRQAYEMAVEAELDLVEVAPNAKPPVCRILDYGKFSYEKTKQLREAQKKQKQIEIKKIRLTPRTADFHRDIHVKKAREWLTEGKKVQFMVRFKARERDYPEIGRAALLEIAELLDDVSEIEQRPKFEGWSMTLMLAPEGSS